MLIVVLVASGGAIVLTRGGGTGSGGPATTVAPKPGECPIDPANGEVAITEAIKSCPNGTTSAPTMVRFPAGRSYTQASRIEVRDRDHLVIDGNGSTFTTTASGSTSKAVNGNWVIIRGTNITLKNMTSVGSFDVPGPRSLKAESADPGYTEATMNYGIYGTDGAWLIDVKGFKAWGDGVTTGPAHYAVTEQWRNDDYANDVHIIRMEVNKTSRHCWAGTSGSGLWIEDSSCTDAWYAGLDSETDNQNQPLRNHHYLRNTFNGFHLGGLLIPVPGNIGTLGDIEVRGNKFMTTPDVACNPTLLVGGYPDPKTVGQVEFSNVTTEDNEFAAYSRAITYDHVNGGAIRNNKIRQLPPPDGATVLQHCGEDRQVIVTNSTGVVVENNG